MATKVFFYTLRPYDELGIAQRLAPQLDVEFGSTQEYPTLENAELAKGYDAVSVTPCDMSTPMVKRFHELGVKSICCRSIGYDHVDRETARELGMKVANVDYPPNGVANFAIMLMLMSLRKAGHILKRGEAQDYSLQGKIGRDISTCTVGVIGTGRIGRTVLQHLSGFGCRLLAYDLYPNDEVKKIAEYVPLETLLAESDVITLHTNATEENHHLIDTKAIERMKPGVTIINTARGKLIDSDALIAGLESGKIGAAGLDVLENENGLYYYNRMGFRDLRLLGESVSADGYAQAKDVLKIVVGLAGLFEGIGIVLLLFAFVPQFGLEGIWVSVFTAISAFCNAGFDLFGRFGQYSSLAPYVNNYYVQAVVMFMIISGGLGFMVWVEIGQYRKKHRLSLQAKVVLSFSVILWLGGAALIALMEWNNPASMGGLSVPGKLMAALFQSVSTRTAGMNTIDLAACGPITKLLMSALQFIGAAPGSTGGGVKVTTFAVIILTIRSVAQGRDDCVIAEHHIESKTVYRALTIIVLGGLAAVGSAVVVFYNTSDAVSVIDAIFESCSAFGTVGLSVGVTAQLNRGAKILYMLVMFMGRVGPVSLAMSLTAKPDDNKRKIMPVGHINVG